MQLIQIQKPDLSEDFIQTVCSVTGAIIHSSHQWTDIHLTRDYSVTFHLINDNILSTYPKGIISYEGTLALFKHYAQFIHATGLANRTFIEISDYSQITNIPSKATRLKVFALLMEHVEKSILRGHFVYNVPKHIKWIYNIGARLEKVEIPMGAVANYTEALKKALKIHGEKLKQPSLTQRLWHRVSGKKKSRSRKEDILEYIGAISWEEQGIPLKNIPASHPYKDVFDALFVLKTDIDHTFNERNKIEKKYKSLFNHIADPIMVFDQKDLHIVDCNQAFLSIYGYTKTELKSMTPHNLHPEEDLERVNQNINNGKRHRINRYTHITKGHKPIDVEIKTDETEYQGRPAWISNIRDITARNKLENELRKHRDALGSLVEKRTRALKEEIAERKQTEKELKHSEEKYRGIIENMQDVFYRTDIHRNLTIISPSGIRLLGYNPDATLLDQNIGTLFYRNSPQYTHFIKTLTKKGQVTNFELVLFTRDGKRIPVMSSSKFYKDSQGNPLGIEGTITNIKERKEAEEQLKHAKTQAESATKTKSEFLANMSHEIRTPMNGIMGMVELILDTPLDAPQKKLASTIDREANALLGIINTILDFSKIEAGKMELEHTSFNLRLLFEDLTATFAIAARKKGIELIAFLPPDTPERLIGDPGRLRQVLVNLVGNAVKFTHKGEIFIWVETLSPKKARDQIKLRFSVKDTGIGIPKEKQDTIFESFAQADGSTTRNYGGTGLGITISKQLVQLMGGDIGLESEPSDGSTFWFTACFQTDPATEYHPPDSGVNGKKILIVDDNKNNQRVTEDWEFPVTRHTGIEKKRKKIRILLAEDYPTNQQVAMKHLSSQGYQVSLAVNGLQAVDLFKNRQFHLILMDIQMPIMDGYEATRLIRKHEKQTRAAFVMNNPAQGNRIQRTPIIAMTAHAVKDYREKCLTADMDDFMTKPLKKKDFLALVHAYTENLNPVISLKSNGSLPCKKNLVTASLGGAPIDLEASLSEFENDKPFFIGVLAEFIKTIGHQIPDMMAAEKKGDFQTLRNHAHSIKGGASNLGAMDLYRAAMTIEESSKRRQIPILPAGLELLEKEFARIKKFARQI